MKYKILKDCRGCKENEQCITHQTIFNEVISHETYDSLCKSIANTCRRFAEARGCV